MADLVEHSSSSLTVRVADPLKDILLPCPPTVRRDTDPPPSTLNPPHTGIPRTPTTATSPSKPLQLLHPLVGHPAHPFQAQHRSRASLDREIRTAILTATTGRAASGNRATSIRRVLAINPSLAQTVSPMRRMILRLARRETSMLRFPLHPTALPLTYIFSWRALSWFYTIDQNNDGKLSHEELRTCSFFKIHSKFGLIIVQTMHSWLTGVRFYFVPTTSAKAHWSPISRQAVLGHHGEISRERLCTYLSMSFRRPP